ncbi:MAG: AIR synthase related protein, partial [Dehalococcoidia bacterium]
KPKWLEGLQSFDMSTVPDLKPRQCNSTLLRLLASPNIASKECVYRQYDHQAMGNTVVPPGSDAAVLRIKGTGKGISLTTDGNGRLCYLDPYLGGVIAVAEAARNLACSGAEPLAITDCLNFGDPEKGDVYYQLKNCIKGMARACRELRIPVISGNVSLYNETKGQAIYPTPIVGMVGLLTDINRHRTMSFKDEGDLVFLLGGGMEDGLGGSEYLELVHGLVRGEPSIDLDLERRVQRCCLEAIQRGFIKSAHDCSEGGLAVAIAESCVVGGIGFKGGSWKAMGRLDSIFFGELQSRVVVSVAPGSVARLDRIATKWDIPVTLLGTVGGKRLSVKGYINLPLAEIGKAWRNGLKQLLNVAP